MWFRVLGSLILLVVSVSVHADVYRWDNGELIPGTEGITPAPGVALEHRELQFARLSEFDLTDSRFDFSNLTKATLESSTLTNANLTGANLTNASLLQSTLTNANLTGAVVSGTGFLFTRVTQEQLASTASFQAKNLQDIRLSYNDLTGWDFSGQNLTNAQFRFSTLTNANLSGANLTGAVLNSIMINADLSGANLTNAFLLESNLTIADLSGAIFTNANLGYATLTNADLSGADLRNANLELTSIDSAVFSTATVYNQWTAFRDGFDPVASGLTLVTSPAGDHDANGILDINDLNLLTTKTLGQLKIGMPDEHFDLNADSIVDASDVQTWVVDLKRTFLGDADLNGAVDFADFLTLADHFGQSGGWSEGDFDTSGDVRFPDFLILSNNFGKSAARATNVPEPFCGLSVLLAFVGCLHWWVRRR